MTKISPSRIKARFSKKLLARLHNGKLMEKLFVNVEKALDSDELEERKYGSDTILKLLPYILPRESNGSPLVNITNNMGGKADKSVEGVQVALLDYLKSRDKRINQLNEIDSIDAEIVDKGPKSEESKPLYLTDKLNKDDLKELEG